MVAAVLQTVLLSATAVASWPTDPLVNLPLCTAVGSQEAPLSIPDGAGGAIVAWTDRRSGAADVYAQRVSGNGDVLWQSDGIALCTADGDQIVEVLIPDGQGGAIVVWSDFRYGRSYIFAQRFSGMGAPLWAVNGVALAIYTHSQENPSAVSDGDGGVIVAWEDWRSYLPDIYAQRIAADGSVLWAASGLPVCTASWSQGYVRVVSDDVGGAFMCWRDQRAGYRIYAQRLAPDGAALWAADGMPVCSEQSAQVGPSMVSDGVGGAIVAWHDDRNGNTDIYSQRLDADGDARWDYAGVPVCTAEGRQSMPKMVTDGAEGAILGWSDERFGAGKAIFAQRIRADGSAAWTPDGVAVCPAAGVLMHLDISSNGLGGVLFTWTAGPDFVPQLNIHAQQVVVTGSLKWPDSAEGVSVCIASGSQYFPAVVSDGGGGAIIAWQDERGGVKDIYAQRVMTNGLLGGASLNRLIRIEVVSADTLAALPGYLVRFDYASDPDTSYFMSEDMDHVRVWAFRPDGQETWLPMPGFVALAPPADSAVGYAWSFLPDLLGRAQTATVERKAIRTTPAGAFEAISCIVRLDEDPITLWGSISLADGVGIVRAYSASARSYIHLGSYFIAGGAGYFPLAAGNWWNYEGDTISDAGDVWAARGRLHHNSPNPFNASTTLAFDLPQAGRARLTIYDVAGQRVTTLLDGHFDAGTHRAQWNGRDDRGRIMASGTYIFRLEAGGYAESQRMVLVK